MEGWNRRGIVKWAKGKWTSERTTWICDVTVRWRKTWNVAFNRKDESETQENGGFKDIGLVC